MREVRKLTICGLTYRVVYATADEVHHLEDTDGYCSMATNTIYVRSGMPKTRTRDALVHELMHAFFEASGVGSFMKDNFRGDEEAFDKFEETFIRLTVPSLLRLVDDNGDALVNVPEAVVKTPAPERARAKRAGKGKRR